MELSENSLIAAGGYDGGIYVCNVNASNHDSKKKDETDIKKFSGHQGVVSCVRFLNTNFLISASYDSVMLLWDINSQGKFLNSYHDHTSEVSGLDVNELNGNIFATGSGDTTVKIWDIREKKACVCTFKGSDSSVNCVKFLPGRLSTLAAGSEDSVIRLYDLRALKELATFKKREGYNSINSIGFSKSGQILFSTSSNCSTIHFWDLFNYDGLPFNSYSHVKFILICRTPGIVKDLDRLQ
jgi:guanine nucleotide-binding protein G(I)/G(S)/G(T) subunit beta-1